MTYAEASAWVATTKAEFTVTNGVAELQLAGSRAQRAVSTPEADLPALVDELRKRLGR